MTEELFIKLITLNESIFNWSRLWSLPSSNERARPMITITRRRSRVGLRAPHPFLSCFNIWRTAIHYNELRPPAEERGRIEIDEI